MGREAEEVNSLFSPAPVPVEIAPAEVHHVQQDQEQFPAPADDEWNLPAQAQEEIWIIQRRLSNSQKVVPKNILKNSVALAFLAKEIYKKKEQISTRTRLQQIFPEFSQMDARIIRKNILLPNKGGGLEFSPKQLQIIYDDIDRSGRDSKWAVILLRELDNYRLFG